jgi:hypothetical protein
MSLVVYDTENDSPTPGRISRVVTTYLPTLPGILSDHGQKHLTIDGPVDMDDHYVKPGPNPLYVPKPVMPIVVSKTHIRPDGKDEAIISGIPKGVEVFVNTQLVPIEDDILIIAVSSPCWIHVRIAKWPYKDFTISVDARS